MNNNSVIKIITYALLSLVCLLIMSHLGLGFPRAIACFFAFIFLGVFMWRLCFGKAGTFDRIISGSFWLQIILLLIVAVYSLGACTCSVMQIGTNIITGETSQCEQVVSIAHRFMGYNYYENDGHSLNVAMLVVSFIGSLILTGLLVTTFSNIIQQRKEDFLSGVLTYSNINNHIVILGFNEVTCFLCKELLQGNKKRVVILTSNGLRQVRTRMRSELGSDIYSRIVVYAGNIEDETSLKRLNINNCNEVYLLGEHGSFGHDSICLSVVKQLCKIIDDRRKGLLSVYLQLDSQSAFSAIQKLDIPAAFTSRETKEGVVRKLIDLHTFNLYENQARYLWGYYKPKNAWELDYSDLDSQPLLLPNSQNRVHLVIAGFGWMGQALLLEALRICHYPNYNEKSGSVKTKITIIDTNLSSIWEEFISQYPMIKCIEDIELEPISSSLESSEVRARLEELAKDPKELLTVAICFWDADTSFAAGISLPDSLYYSLIGNSDAENNKHVRILIRDQFSSGISDIITSDASKYKNVRFFGTPENALSMSLLDDKAAILQNAHYDSLYEPKEKTPKRKIYDELVGVLKTKNVSILSAYENGELDSKQVLSWARRFWNETTENHKCSNRYQIEMYGIYGRYLQCLQMCYADQCDTIISQMEHRRWCAERYIMGYQYADLQKGSMLKEQKDNWKVHNDLVPFSELADKERAKDLVHLTMPAINDIVKSHS